jgi:hypothetical protein
MDRHTFEITHITINGRTYLATGQLRFIQDNCLNNAPGGIRLPMANAIIASADFRIPTIVDGEVVKEEDVH